MTVIRPVILSGGSGTRLWPLSTTDRPKQFADLIDGLSLFGSTLVRLADLPGVGSPVVVAGADHIAWVKEAASAVDVELGPIIVEPEARNTAPAIAAAALHSDAGDVMVILPSDHLITDVAGFGRHVLDAVELAAADHIVIFGAPPSRADTGYGYIETGGPIGKARELVRFKEKPDTAEAQALVSDGRHLWNLGIFVARAGIIIEEMAVLCPGVLDPVRYSMSVTDGDICLLGSGFSDAERISFDHAVMEGTRRGVVIPIDVGWSDIGAYPALLTMSSKDGAGNAITGRVVVEDVTGSFIHASSRKVVVSGVSGLVVIETEEAVLVVPLERAQEVRHLAERAGEV